MIARHAAYTHLLKEDELGKTGDDIFLVPKGMTHPDWVRTIEGNSNEPDGREGFEVWERRRSAASCDYSSLA